MRARDGNARLTASTPATIARYINANEKLILVMMGSRSPTFATIVGNVDGGNFIPPARMRTGRPYSPEKKVKIKESGP